MIFPISPESESCLQPVLNLSDNASFVDRNRIVNNQNFFFICRKCQHVLGVLRWTNCHIIWFNLLDLFLFFLLFGKSVVILLKTLPENVLKEIEIELIFFWVFARQFFDGRMITTFSFLAERTNRRVQPLFMLFVQPLQIVNGNRTLSFPGSLFDPPRTSVGIALHIYDSCNLGNLVHGNHITVALEINLILRLIKDIHVAHDTGKNITIR